MDNNKVLKNQIFKDRLSHYYLIFIKVIVINKKMTFYVIFYKRERNKNNMNEHVIFPNKNFIDFKDNMRTTPV